MPSTGASGEPRGSGERPEGRAPGTPAPERARPREQDGLIWDERPSLRRPMLLAAFEGWNDAADAASDAAAWLTRRFGAHRFAGIDPEEHFDFQSRRPEVELVGGVTRKVAWPANECFAARLEHESHDLVVLRGVEPSYRWRSFCRAVLTVASATGCEMVITFGALLADVPHTRTPSITGAATDPAVIERLGLARSRYEGPTGIVGALHDACRESGVPSVSLWAPVPHYIAAPPNPVATRALLERFGVLTGTTLDLSELEQLAETWRKRVDEVVADDTDVSAYVRKLEEQADSAESEEIPSGEALAAEFERFLREQRGGEGSS